MLLQNWSGSIETIFTLEDWHFSGKEYQQKGATLSKYTRVSSLNSSSLFCGWFFIMVGASRLSVRWNLILKLNSCCMNSHWFECVLLLGKKNQSHKQTFGMRWFSKRIFELVRVFISILMTPLELKERKEKTCYNNKWLNSNEIISTYV